MEYRFPYKTGTGIDRITIPDRGDVRVYAAKSLPEVRRPLPEIVRGALLQPVGLPPLTSLLNPNQSVLLLVDDMSRPTPARDVLGCVLEEIHRAGVQKSRV